MSRHEQSDVNIGKIVWVAIIMMVSAVVIHIAVWWIYDYLRTAEMQEDVRRTLVEPPSAIPPQPRLQASPEQDWTEYRRTQLQILNSYGWVSREAGRVRIPIDRAMELVAEREER